MQPTSNSAEASVEPDPQHSPPTAGSDEREKAPFPFGERPTTFTENELDLIRKAFEKVLEAAVDKAAKETEKKFEKHAKRERWMVLVVHGIMFILGFAAEHLFF